MKKIVAANGTFGPYSSVQTLADHWLVDGAVLPMTVAGAGTVLDVQAGDFPAPPPLPPTVPSSVTMRQARLALLAAGKLAAVAPAIAAMPSAQRSAAEIEWEYSIEVQRNRPLVLALGPALGLNAAALDALFIAAAKL